MVYYHRLRAPNLCANSCPDARGPRTTPPAPSILRASAAPFQQSASLLAPLFGVEPVRGSSGCVARKTVLGPRTGGSQPMESTAAHRESSGALAWRAPARSGLAPLTLPVWAVEPWFGVGFHCAHISSIIGIFLYPISDGFARHVWLGPQTTARGKSSNAD